MSRDRPSLLQSSRLRPFWIALGASGWTGEDVTPFEPTQRAFARSTAEMPLGGPGIGDAPSDVAPVDYNEYERCAGLPPSPIDLERAANGFRTATSGG